MTNDIKQASVLKRFVNFFQQSSDRGIQMIEWALGVLVGASLFLPRSSWLFFCLLAIVVVTIWVIRDWRMIGTSLKENINRPAMLFAGFVAIAVVSASWSVNAAHTFTEAAILAILSVLAYVTLSFFPTFRSPSAAPIARGAVVGFSVGLIYLILELLSDGAIRLYLHNELGLYAGVRTGFAGYLVENGKAIRFYAGAFNRNFVTLSLIFFVILACFIQSAKHAFHLNRWFQTFFIIVAIIAVFSSHSESSKLAITAGTLVLLISWLVPKLTVYVVSAMIAVAVLLPVAATQVLLDSGIKQVGYFQKSGQVSRLNIYEDTIKNFYEHPILGSGAATSGLIVKRIDTEGSERGAASHPHNMFLEVWQELGVVGGITLWLLIQLLVWKIPNTPKPFHGYLFAQVITTVAVLSVSYSLWQTWLVASIFTSFLIGVAALHASGKK